LPNGFTGVTHHQPARRRFLPFAAYRSGQKPLCDDVQDALMPRAHACAGRPPECNQVFMMTIFTTYSQKNVFETTTLLNLANRLFSIFNHFWMLKFYKLCRFRKIFIDNLEPLKLSVLFTLSIFRLLSYF
jgi:hypothetical protein